MKQMTNAAKKSYPLKNTYGVFPDSSPRDNSFSLKNKAMSKGGMYEFWHRSKRVSMYNKIQEANTTYLSPGPG